jgi:hypothetical protein
MGVTLIGTGNPSDLRSWENRLHKSDHTERDIEAPWAQAAINDCAGSWLDVGYVWTDASYWKGVDFMGARCVGLDIAPPRSPHSFDVTIEADINTYKFTEHFDLVTCISTLEHIGCDNTRYKQAETRYAHPVSMQQAVVKKLREASSRLLVSVPFGMFEDHGWFLQYNQEMVEALDPTEVGYYRLGGQKVRPEQLAKNLYRTDELRASAVALMEFL